MRTTELPDWQRRRSEFNHQWLKNKLLSALDCAANVMRGKLKGGDYVGDVVENDIREWERRRVDLDRLLADFESEMSPQALFEILPLSHWEPELKATMGELLHCLWLSRYPVKDWVEDARKAAQSVNRSYEQLIHTFAAGATANDSGEREFVARFETFRSACRSLAKSIEQFPKTILVL